MLWQNSAKFPQRRLERNSPNLHPSLPQHHKCNLLQEQHHRANFGANQAAGLLEELAAQIDPVLFLDNTQQEQHLGNF